MHNIITIFAKSFLVVVIAVIADVNSTIPDYIDICPHDHQNISGCIANSIQKLTPFLKVGIEDIGVPALEPLYLGKMTIDRLGEDSRLATNLSDVNVHGASDFKILKLFHTLTKYGHNFQFEVLIPQLHVEGQYQIDTKVLFLNLKGNGPFNLNMTDYHFACLIKGKKVKEETITHLKFEKMKCDVVIGKANILLDNLFNGHQVLEKATNAAINDNIDVLLESIKPDMEAALDHKFTEIADRITSAFAYDELFP